MEKRPAVLIAKFSAAITLVAFLFLPQVGCGEIVFSGLDLTIGPLYEKWKEVPGPLGDYPRESSWGVIPRTEPSPEIREIQREAQRTDTLMMFFSLLIILSALAVLISREIGLILFPILGLASLFLLFLISKMQFSDELGRGMQSLIEIKYGGFLTVLGFLGTIFAGISALSKDEKTKPSETTERPSTFPPLEMEAKEKPFKIEEIKKFFLLAARLAKKYLLLPYEAMPQKTNDRIAVFYGASLLIFFMALNFVRKFRYLEELSGLQGFWLGFQLPILVGGICLLIISYQKKFYPFDPKSSPE